jgi:hypothetical protein
LLNEEKTRALFFQEANSLLQKALRPQSLITQEQLLKEHAFPTQPLFAEDWLKN